MIAVTFESLDIGSSFWVGRYIFRNYSFKGHLFLMTYLAFSLCGMLRIINRQL